MMRRSQRRSGAPSACSSEVGAESPTRICANQRTESMFRFRRNGTCSRRERIFMAAGQTGPAVGIGYRAPMHDWTRANLARFDVLEITVDHCLSSGTALRSAIFDLVGRIPLTAHGVGLSIGTDAPLDLAYLDDVAEVVERLRAPAYSEHLAFTRVPGRDLANLLPLPKTEDVAEQIIGKVKVVQSRVP